MKKNLLAVLLVTCMLFSLCSCAITDTFASVESLCSQAKYEQAYKKAKGAEKNAVLGENTIAYLCNDILERSDSIDAEFEKLEAAYYHVSYNKGKDRIYQQAVLLPRIKPSSSDNGFEFYFIYTADENGVWGEPSIVESLYLNSSDDDYIASLIGKVIVENEDTMKLTGKALGHINDHIKSDTVSGVKLFDFDKYDTSVMPLDGSDSDD